MCNWPDGGFLRAKLRGAMLAAAATGTLSFVITTQTSSVALADGGDGGNVPTCGAISGGLGGAGYTGNDGQPGGFFSGCGGPGGGGGAAGGGDGGDGGNTTNGSGSTTGGTGGTGSTNPAAPGDPGAPGGTSGISNVSGAGGGGGGGGANGNGAGAASINNVGALSGSAGGAGGAGGAGTGIVGAGGGGGGGGAGGYGAIVTGSGTATNSGTISGGAGGDGGAGGAGTAVAAGAGGGGGDGGVGVLFTAGGTTFTNSGTISGGNGGAGGTGSSSGAAGQGGAGVIGSDLTVINSGSIAGGLFGNGVDRANAISFTGGSNILELQAGYSFIGNVVDQTDNGTFRLGGGSTSSFDVSLLGSAGQYQGFATFEKTGASTWILNNSTSEATFWTISQGGLTVTNNGSLGVGRVTIDGGFLQAGAAGLSIANEIFTTTTATIDTAATTMILNGSSSGVSLSGTGTFTKTGAAPLYVQQVGMNGGTVRVQQGSVRASGGNDLGQATNYSVDLGADLDVNGANQTIQSLAGNGVVRNTGGGPATLTVGTNNTVDTTPFTFGGSIVDGLSSLALSVDGTRPMILTGANTYSGGTLVCDCSILQIGNGGTGGSITGDVRLGGKLVFNRSDSYTFAGRIVDTIGGHGNVEQAGGVLSNTTLSGNNTYSGTTTVRSGILTAAGGTAIGDLSAVTVMSGAELRISADETIGSLAGGGDVVQNGFGQVILTVGADNTSTTFSGVIRDNGGMVERIGLTKIGDGTLKLTGLNLYGGPTEVSAGKLVVNGSIAGSSSLTVGSGGELGGTGTLPTTIVSGGGTFAPGNSIGTINVAGNVTFNSGSTYQVEVDAAGNSDLINATGTATINGGTVSVLAQSGDYAPRTTYTILTAAGGRTGTFTDVASNLAFLEPSLSYDANNVYLLLERNETLFPDVARTPNQRAVAGALSQFPTDNDLYLEILNQTAAGARQAFDALSGEIHASIGGALIDESRHVRDAVMGRMIQASYDGTGLGAGGPESANGNMMMLGYGSKDLGSYAEPRPVAEGPTFWTQGFGSWASFDGNGNAASLDRDMGGFISGVDAEVMPGWRAGIAAGYSYTGLDEDARLSSADVDAYHLVLYGSGKVDRFNFRGGGAWSWQDIETSRNVVFPGFSEFEEASYDGDRGQLFGEIAYPFLYGNIGIESFTGLAYVHQETDSFTESGALAGLTSAGYNEDVTYSTTGVRAATTMNVGETVVTPSLSVAWLHAFDSVDTDLALAFASAGPDFTIQGTPIARDSALITVGLDFAVSANATLSIAYDGQFASDADEHGIKGRATWRF